MGMATPERDVGVASTKKEMMEIMSVADTRYILSVPVGNSAGSPGSERLGWMSR